MKHIPKRGVAFILSIFFLLLIMFSYQLISEKKDALLNKTMVRYKINASLQEDNSIRRYQVVYETTPQKQDHIKYPNILIEGIAGKLGGGETWAIAYLRSHIDDTILTPRDYNFFIEFRHYFMTHFPENWKMKLDIVIEASFSNIINDIKRFYDGMDEYDTWFARNKNLLATMTPADIKAVLRQKREEIFGNDTEQIWNFESNHEYLDELLAIFNGASHISLEDKALVFASIWDEMSKNAGPEISEEILKFQRDFLNMDSVQMELQQMSVAKRAESLSRIRSMMGFNETKIEEMEQFDIHQDKDWGKGQSYMAERQHIIANYVDGEREQQLRALRQRYFNQEATIIASEEAVGIFRFERKRIYGHR